MAKEWFVLIDGKREGPFTPQELKRDRHVTLDTLVWKQGFTDWVPIRKVPELKVLFEGEEGPPKVRGEEQPEIDLGPYQMVLAAQRDPPHLIFWLILAAIIMLYVFIELYKYHGSR